MVAVGVVAADEPRRLRLRVPLLPVDERRSKEKRPPLVPAEAAGAPPPCGVLGGVLLMLASTDAALMCSAPGACPVAGVIGICAGCTAELGVGCNRGWNYKGVRGVLVCVLKQLSENAPEWAAWRRAGQQ